MTRGLPIAVSVVASLLIGSALGWYLRGSHPGEDRGSVAVVHEVEVAAFCSAALQISQEGRTAALHELLEGRMISALGNAADRSAGAAAIGFPVPEMIEGITRARRYAVANGMPEAVGKCDRILEFLARSNARA